MGKKSEHYFFLQKIKVKKNSDYEWEIPRKAMFPGISIFEISEYELQLILELRW